MRRMYCRKFAHFVCRNILYCSNLGKDYQWALNKNDALYKKPHTAIFIGQTGCGKTHLVLELIENYYNKHFDNIVIICPTLRENVTHHAEDWIKKDYKVWLVDPKDNLYQWIQKLSELLRFLEILFIIDYIIVNESLDKRRQPLLELSFSGRHRNHYLWLLTQSFTVIPKNLRRQAKTIFVWYPKERGDLKAIHEENDVLTDNKLVVARAFLKRSKYACLYIQNEFPYGFRLLNAPSAGPLGDHV